MKIAIIGGGWVGCHLSKKLMNNHDITLYEKNDLLFEESSYNNQNRLHLGYHYSRNSKTRNLCKNTFEKFESEYGFLLTEISNNYYCVPKNKSLIDFNTYHKIFQDYDHEHLSKNFLDFEGCLNTKEKHINFRSAKIYFNDILRSNFSKKEITKKDIKNLKNNFDLVINCTNNFLKISNETEHFYELTLSFLYKKIGSTEFDALTLVDGELFSIYPYNENIYTVTDVLITPLKKFKSSKKIKEFVDEISNSYIDKKRNLIEKKISHFYPNFLKDFNYFSYFLATKSKVKNMSDDRSPIINVDENLINVFTGKIQGIYLIEEFITDHLKKHESLNR